MLAGSYKFDKVRLTASATQTTYLTSKHTSMLLGAVVNVGAGDIKLSYIKVNQQGRNAAGASIDANDANSLALGYVHNLSKRSAFYTTHGGPYRQQGLGDLWSPRRASRGERRLVVDRL